MPNLYDYVNYRLYLQDFLAEHKKDAEPDYSHKMILAKMGISSTGFLSNVIAGRKNLTPIQIIKLVKILHMNKAESAYFEAMVYFTQAKLIDEKNEYFNRLVTLQKVNLKVLDKKKMSVFSKWYYVVVRELLYFYRYNGGDPSGLGHKVEPTIRRSEAIQAIRYLEELGLITRNADGYYRQVENAVTSGDEVKSLHLTNFQLATMELAKRAIQKIPAAERDVSVLTMTLSRDTFQMVKSELQHIRKRIAKIAVDEDKPDRVYQLNMQFFPVTKKPEDSSSNA
jgi:uncharacterized protein (TIGR02147 family)